MDEIRTGLALADRTTNGWNSQTTASRHTDKAARSLRPISLPRNGGSSYSGEPGVEVSTLLPSHRAWSRQAILRRTPSAAPPCGQRSDGRGCDQVDIRSCLIARLALRTAPTLKVRNGPHSCPWLTAGRPGSLTPPRTPGSAPARAATSVGNFRCSTIATTTLRSEKRGGGINAAILAKHCTGVITRCVAPLRSSRTVARKVSRCSRTMRWRRRGPGADRAKASNAL